MKKLSFVLALIMIVSALFVACSNDKDTTSDQTTTTPKVTTPSRRTEGSQEPPDEPEAPELADVEITIDGSLEDWTALGLHTIAVQGEKFEGTKTDGYNQENSENRKATFYGVLAKDGLYLACDAYHDTYVSDSVGEWYTNSNFEFFVGANKTHCYVYARGFDAEPSTSNNENGLITSVAMKTEKIDQATVYHTVTEVFVATENLSEGDILYNTIDVGVAWKTEHEDVYGGAGTVRNGMDDWWVPKDSWPDGGNRPIVAPSGIFLSNEFDL